MIARFITLMLIVVLALPVASLIGPTESRPSPWSGVAAAAEGKKHKQKTKAPQFTTVTRTVRQTVTQTFTSADPIIIPDGAGPNATKGKADPYPSAIAVSGFTHGTITDVNLILNDFSHSLVHDVDVLLSAGGGRRALVMSDVGSALPATDRDLTLDDEAAAPLADGFLNSGTFRPTNLDGTDDAFDAPAPAPNGSAALSTFDGADPNGEWQLWVMDNGSAASGDIGVGWALEITAEVDVQVEEQVPVAKAKKQKKKGKGRR